MAQRTKRWTRDELARLPEDGNRYEVVRGELFVTPAPRPRHEQVIYELVDHLKPYVDGQRIGEVHWGRSAMVFEDSEVEPDIVIRVSTVPPPENWDGVPLPFLVVEVTSEATRRRDRIAKRVLYMDAGIPEYWIVDGDDRTITVVRRDEVDIVANGVLRWHPAGATAPLHLDVAAVFRESLGDL